MMSKRFSKNRFIWKFMLSRMRLRVRKSFVCLRMSLNPWRKEYTVYENKNKKVICERKSE